MKNGSNRVASVGMLLLAAACSEKTPSAELIAIAGPGEPVFASDLRGVSIDQGDLVIELSDDAASRLAAVCADGAQAGVLVKISGRVAERRRGCEGLGETTLRLGGAARFGSEIPEHLRNVARLEPPGSTQPVILLGREQLSVTLDAAVIGAPQWRDAAMSFTPRGALARALLQAGDTQMQWMIVYDGLMLGGWDRVEVTPDRITLRTTNAPAMQAWRASLEP